VYVITLSASLLLCNVNVMWVFRFKANGLVLNVIEVTEYSSGTYHCVVIDKNDQTHTADHKLGKCQLFIINNLITVSHWLQCALQWRAVCHNELYIHYSCKNVLKRFICCRKYFCIFRSSRSYFWLLSGLRNNRSFVKLVKFHLF